MKYPKGIQISATAVVFSAYLIWKNLLGYSQIQWKSQSHSDVLEASEWKKADRDRNKDCF